MRMNLARLSVLAVVVLGAGQALWAQAAPTLDIPEASIKGTLEAQQLKQMDEYVQFYAKSIAQATNEDAVVAARNKILEAYNRYDSGEFRSNYAQMTAKQLLPLLDVKGPLKNVRQINVGMTIAKMPQASIKPALEKMVAGPDPVVRYYGWVGFREIRAALLAQNKETADGLFQLLAAQMPKEKSGPVLGVMFEVLNLSSVDLGSVQDDVRKFAADRVYTIMMANWPACLRGVAAGKVQIANACRDGVNTLLSLESTFGQDKAKHKAIVQALVDLMWNAAVAYDKAQAVTDKDPKAKADADAVSDAAANLMVTAEAATNIMVGKKLSYVQGPLADPRVKERGAEVQLGVLKWVDEFKAIGIAQPQTAVEPKTSAPASAPVSRPAK